MKLYFIEKEVAPGAWAFTVVAKKYHYAHSALSGTRFRLIPALIAFALINIRFPKQNFRLVKKEYCYMEKLLRK